MLQESRSRLEIASHFVKLVRTFVNIVTSFINIVERTRVD